MIGKVGFSPAYRMQSLIRKTKNESERDPHQQGGGGREQDSQEHQELQHEDFEKALEKLREELEKQGLSAHEIEMNNRSQVEIVDQTGKVLQTLSGWQVVRRMLLEKTLETTEKKGSLLDKSY